MLIFIKNDITYEKIVIPKKTKGLVVGVQWGTKNGDGFVVDFPSFSRVFVHRDNAVIIGEKELPPPTVGKGSE
jgi:hypothetical protein